MNKQMLINIYEKAKILKTDIILLQNGILYGVNKEYTIARVYEGDMSNIDKNITFTYLHGTSMSKFINYIKDSESEITFCGSYITCDDEIIGVNNIFHMDQVMRIMSKFFYDTNQSPVVSIDNLIDYFGYNPFDKKSAIKDTIKIDRNHILLIYGKMISMNKGDKLALDIFDTNNNEISVWRFTVIKKHHEKVISYIAALNIS